MTNEKEFTKNDQTLEEDIIERWGDNWLLFKNKLFQQARKEAQVAHARDILRLRSEWIEECIRLISKTFPKLKEDNQTEAKYSKKFIVKWLEDYKELRGEE